MSKQRWLVIYEQINMPTREPGMNYRSGPRTKASMIDDDAAGGNVSMPYGVEPNQVADDCGRILAIILCADAPNVPFVVIDDKEFSLDPKDPMVKQDEVPAAS